MSDKSGFFTVFRLCVYQLNVLFRQSRIYVVWGVLTLYLYSLLTPLRELAGIVGNENTIWVFAALINDYIFPYLMLSLVIILFCNAPFYDQMSMYVIGRSGKLLWVIAMLLFLFLSSGLFIGMVLVSIMFCFAGTMQFTLGWGECLRLQAYGELPENLTARFYVNGSLLSGYSPMEAMVLTVLLCWLVIFMLLLIVFIGNYIFNEFAGAGISLGLVLLDLTIVNLLGNQWYKVSPASFMKLTVLTSFHVNPTILYAFKALGICILVLTALTILTVVKTKGLVEKDE